MNTTSMLSLSGAVLAISTCAGVSAQSLASYGTGTSGTGNKTPSLWATSTPRPGNSKFGLTIEEGLPNATAVAFLSLARANVTVGGVGVLIDFSQSFQYPFLKLDASGAGTYALPVPNQSNLIGASVVHQAFVADAGGAPLGFSATQGLQLTVANFGLLIGTRSTGKADPQIAINLDTGKQSTFSYSSMTNVDIPDMYPFLRTHCMVGSGRSNKVALFDCQVFPPKFVTEFTAKGTPWAVTWNPDGIRAYIVNQSSSSGTPSVQAVWGQPSTSNFGKPFPGGDISITQIDALRMLFNGNGSIGYLGVLGLIGGGGELIRYDTKISSSTYHKATGSFKVSGEYMWDLCLLDDVTMAVATAGLGGNAIVRVIDLATMKQTTAFGQSMGPVISGMEVDPRGRFLYVGNSPGTNAPAGIVRVDLRKSSPNYGKSTMISGSIASNWRVYDVELSDAGDLLYAIVGTGIQTSFKGAIHEYDTNTLKLTRSWSMNALGNLYYLEIR